MVGSDDICFKEEGIFGRGMRRDRLETALGSKKKTPAGNDLFVWMEKIALLEGVSVKAMSSGDGQVRF